jgi:2-keto-4-pentenoate hydratase/2-oxohepta-3-ene-1,7-dioic acid hydratase in catechol pathway
MDRIYRVQQGGAPFYAIERDGELTRAVLSNGHLFDGYSAGERVEGGLDAVRALAPVAPSKIVCVGLNYKDHAAEVKKALPAEPLIFIKPPTALLNPGDAIRLPPGVGRVDYEGELAVVVGRRAHRVPRAKAREHVFGITCLNDVTARDLQAKDVQYTRAKGFDTFAPLGPCIAVGAGEEPRRVETWVNGARRQGSSTAQLIFGIDELVEFISFVMTLEPGDVISTGTPAGIGPLAAGDRVTVKVEGVGELTNRVEDEP